MEKSIIQQYNDLDQIIKILLQIFLGGLISSVYRILRYTETKNTTTLVIGVAALFTGGFFGILAIIDLVTLAMRNQIDILVD